MMRILLGYAIICAAAVIAARSGIAVQGTIFILAGYVGHGVLYDAIFHRREEP